MNTPMRRTAFVVGILALGLSAQSYARADEVTGSATYVNDNGSVVHCVATESGRTYCGKPHMRYVIRNPNTVCVEGKTWGTDDQGTWVTGGCTADFDASANVTTRKTTTTVTTRTEPGRVVHCVATESGRTYCGVHHTHYVMSGNPNPVCVEGSTWGFDDHGVWVTGGCRGDFTYNDND